MTSPLSEGPWALASYLRVAGLGKKQVDLGGARVVTAVMGAWAAAPADVSAEFNQHAYLRLHHLYYVDAEGLSVVGLKGRMLLLTLMGGPW